MSFALRAICYCGKSILIPFNILFSCDCGKTFQVDMNKESEMSNEYQYAEKEETD